MSKSVRYALGGVALGASLLLASPAVTHAEQGENQWGQQVKNANLNGGYGEGNSRGDYVREQARDDDGDNPGRGYGEEIHVLANPGDSDPNLP
jgi:hypothetical protein